MTGMLPYNLLLQHGKIHVYYTGSVGAQRWLLPKLFVIYEEKKHLEDFSS